MTYEGPEVAVIARWLKAAGARDISDYIEVKDGIPTLKWTPRLAYHLCAPPVADTRTEDSTDGGNAGS